MTKSNTTTPAYQRGEAAGYWAWLNKQTPEVAKTAAQFRPWEFYKLDGREIYVRIVSYDPSGELLDVQQENGVIFTVTPYQFELVGLTIEELPANRLYQAEKAA